MATEMSPQFEHITLEEHQIIQSYEHLFNNTGGNDPAELLNDLKGPGGGRMMQTNIVRYLLAFAVMSQVTLLRSLRREKKLVIQ